MNIWIWIAMAGGILCLGGLAVAVNQYRRGRLRPGELILLLIGLILIICLAIVDIVSGKNTSGWIELVGWLLILSAVVINNRWRKQQSQNRDGRSE